MKNICLAMIVKNEEAVIARCLRSALKHVDTWCIFDTGSTDKTKEIIQETMRGMPGALLDTNWTNFGEARTKVFNYIYKNKMARFALVLDADDVIESNELVLGEIYDAYEVKIASDGIEFPQLRIFNMSKEWEYEGKVHELPMIKGTGEHGLITPLWDTIIHHKSDGNSWKDEKKSQTYIDLARSQDLSNPRHQFYYAQVLRGAGRNHEAIKEYEKRVKMTTGWKQEAVYSQLMIARLYHMMGEQDKAALEYMACYEMDRERSEALTELVCMFRRGGKFNLGAMFGNELMKTKTKTTKENKLFAETINWAAIHNEIGLCAYYTGDKKRAAKLWKEALRMRPDKDTKNFLNKNLKYVK